MGSPNELSFLPDDYMERKLQRRTNAICAMLFFIVMLAIGSAFTITERSVQRVEKEHEQVEQEYTDAARRIQLVQQLRDKQQRMAQQADLAASLLEKVPRSHILAEITNALPAGVSLLDFNLESKLRAAPVAPTAKTGFEAKRADSAADARKKPDAVQIKMYDVTIKITGVASTDVQVAQFIGRLNQSPLLKDVNLIISDDFKQQEQDQQVRRFQLEATLDPNAQVTPDMERPKTAAIEIKETP